MEVLCREHFRIYYFRVKTCILRDLVMRLFLCQDLVVRILVFNYFRVKTLLWSLRLRNMTRRAFLSSRVIQRQGKFDFK